MIKVFLFLSALLLLNSCPTPESQSKDLDASPAESPVVIPSIAPQIADETKLDLIDALVAAPKLVHYGEDGAMDGSVLKLYNIDSETTTAPPKEVADIIALREKAIPLLIEHLNDNRLTAATFNGGYIRDREQPIKVPVGHICLDILLHIVDNSFYYDKNCQIETRLGGCTKDGYYFRPDDYTAIGDERPIVRIVKANWQKAYNERRLKYNFKVTWK